MTAWDRRDDGDPTSALADILDALDHGLRLSRATAKRSEGNRLRLLFIHGGAALIIAPLFLVYSTTNGLSSTSWTLLRSIPGAPHTVAAWLFAAGIVVMLGSAARHAVVAAVGLGMMAAWYLSFSVTFTYAAWQWWDAGADPKTMPGIYAGPLYFHLCVIMGLQMVTALRMRGHHEP